MLELLDDPKQKAISVASSDVVYVLQNLLQKNKSTVVAEIGVGIGATSVEIAKWLSDTGEFHIYDFEDRVVSLKADLENLGYKNLFSHGNTRKKFDGYYWELAKTAIKIIEQKKLGMFDFVYLDGAHSFYQDAPAACALKHLVKPGGYLLFDDYKWSFNTSPSMNPEVFPEIKEWYTDEQLETPHIGLVCSMFFDTDEHWKYIEIPDSVGWRRLYQRIS